MDCIVLIFRTFVFPPFSLDFLHVCTCQANGSVFFLSKERGNLQGKGVPKALNVKKSKYAGKRYIRGIRRVVIVFSHPKERRNLQGKGVIVFFLPKENMYDWQMERSV